LIVHFSFFIICDSASQVLKILSTIWTLVVQAAIGLNGCSASFVAVLSLFVSRCMLRICFYSDIRVILCLIWLFQGTHVNEQWYTPLLKEWTHYIPLQGDLGDLEKQLIWAKREDSKTHDIARQSKRFAEQCLTQACIDQYLWKLIKIYEAAQSPALACVPPGVRPVKRFAAP
jgi:hypothetical protein